MRLSAVSLASLLFLTSAGLLGGQTPGTEAGNKGLKMALVNLKSVYSDTPDRAVNQANIDANLKRHFFFIDRLAAEKVDFVGFPEISLNGYRFSKNMTWLKIDGPEVKALQESHRKGDLHQRRHRPRGCRRQALERPDRHRSAGPHRRTASQNLSHQGKRLR